MNDFGCPRQLPLVLVNCCLCSKPAGGFVIYVLGHWMEQLKKSGWYCDEGVTACPDCRLQYDVGASLGCRLVEAAADEARPRRWACGRGRCGGEGDYMKHSYLVWSDKETEADALVVEASDHGYAAEEWAEESENNDADYPILGGSAVVVNVRINSPGTKVHRLEVTGGWSPSYFAAPVQPEDPTTPAAKGGGGI